MTTPTKILLDHLGEVRAAFTQGGGPVKAWNLLRDTCPAIAEGMALNSFRTTAPVVLGVATRLAPPPIEHDPPPKTFQGWTVGIDRKGYIRLHRKLGGRLRSAYVGRVWDPVKAQERVTIAEREATDSRGD